MYFVFHIYQIKPPCENGNKIPVMSFLGFFFFENGLSCFRNLKSSGLNVSKEWSRKENEVIGKILLKIRHLLFWIISEKDSFSYHSELVGQDLL